ncbi:TonB-dependent hemin, ferrichrome receptor [Klebsiella pneumoniae]|nr:TonB-dependent hemin, ferrichrome receptor [Klebsiella pneumoniae]
MYKSTPSAAWCKKRLLVTSLFAAIYQTSAIAADTSAVSGEAVDDTSEQMTVTAPAPVQKAGSEHSISARELENKGANDFGSIMRYEPLISATGASGGSGNGKSGFDRGGYTGYNIRGMESNRVGIDVDGIAQPNATGRRLRRPRRAQHLRHRPRLYRPVYVRQRGYPVRRHLDGNGQQRYRGECLLPPEISG